MVAGTIKPGGSGCYCPENVLLKRLFKHLIVDTDEVVIMDMEAGIEHLGRGTCEGMDMLVVVVEPGLRSIQTAYSVRKMSQDLHIRSLFIVANKIKSINEYQSVAEKLKDFSLIGSLPYSEQVRKSDLGNFSPCQADKKFTEAVSQIAKKIDEYIEK
ncbi:MAG: hypothetical protein U5N58_13560 [Actinomycetota bacterium]|nr:hypothetical protein [Actinomycetota bacterium]